MKVDNSSQMTWSLAGIPKMLIQRLFSSLPSLTFDILMDNSFVLTSFQLWAISTASSAPELLPQIVLRSPQAIRPQLEQRPGRAEVRTQSRRRRPRNVRRPRLRVRRTPTKRFHKNQIQEFGRSLPQRLLRSKVKRKQFSIIDKYGIDYK